MRAIKKKILSFWLLALLLPKNNEHQFFTTNGIAYLAVKVKTKHIPQRVNINNYNISVKTIESNNEIKLPVDLADGIQCYAGAGISGILIIAMTSFGMADYCKAIVLASA